MTKSKQKTVTKNVLLNLILDRMDVKPLKELLDKIDLPSGARLKCYYCPMNAKWVVDKKPLCQEDYEEEIKNANA